MSGHRKRKWRKWDKQGKNQRLTCPQTPVFATASSIKTLHSELTEQDYAKDGSFANKSVRRNNSLTQTN